MNALREICAARRTANISVLIGENEDPKPPAGTVDVAVMVNVLSALENVDTRNFLANVGKGLTPDGRLVIIEWDPVTLHQVTAREFEPEVATTLRRLYAAHFEVVKTSISFPGRACGSACGRRTRRDGVGREDLGSEAKRRAMGAVDEPAGRGFSLRGTLRRAIVALADISPGSGTAPERPSDTHRQ